MKRLMLYLDPSKRFQFMLIAALGMISIYAGHEA